MWLISRLADGYALHPPLQATLHLFLHVKRRTSTNSRTRGRLITFRFYQNINWNDPLLRPIPKRRHRGLFSSCIHLPGTQKKKTRAARLLPRRCNKQLNCLKTRRNYTINHVIIFKYRVRVVLSQLWNKYKCETAEQKQQHFSIESKLGCAIAYKNRID